MTNSSSTKTGLDKPRHSQSDANHATLQDVKRDVGQLKSDVQKDMGQLKRDVSEYASGAANSGMEAAREGAAHLMEQGKHVADTAKDTHTKMCEYVRANPTTSVLLAVGVGAILARFLPRA